MAETPEEISAIFPVLDDAQIARLRAFGEERHVQAGEIVFDQGDTSHGVFVVLEGSIDIVDASKNDDAPLRVVKRGDFTGEVNLLSGRRSLVRCRAKEASSLLEIGRANLRRILQTDAALGELLLRAFLLRRLYLI